MAPPSRRVTVLVKPATVHASEASGQVARDSPVSGDDYLHIQGFYRNGMEHPSPRLGSIITGLHTKWELPGANDLIVIEQSAGLFWR